MHVKNSPHGRCKYGPNSQDTTLLGKKKGKEKENKEKRREKERREKNEWMKERKKS